MAHIPPLTPPISLLASMETASMVSPMTMSPLCGHSSHESITFNLIYDRTTLPLDNDGPDITFHNDDKAYGWSLPSCRTYGTITINKQVIHIDPQHSLTWYDRQWGGEFDNNWTLFHLHMPGGFELSIWAGDGGGIPKERLATIRDVRGSLKLVGLSWTPLERTWYSSASKQT